MSLLTVGVVLATVTMTFGALVAVFVIRSEALVFWGHIQLPSVLWLTTAVLLLSSGALELGRKRLALNRQAEAHSMLAWTLALGSFFLVGQIVAWRQVLRSGIVLAHNPHSWFIFLFTGLHALHIVLGLAGIGYLYTRTSEVVSGPRYLMKTRVLANGISIFWHYLDILWLVLFTLLLVWRA